MISEIFPEFYDALGRKTLRPSREQRKDGFRPTFPMGRNFSQPLQTRCTTFEEMRRFLASCRPDRSELHNRKHRWQPPEEFEETRTGLCVDFAIWAWRQVLEMGYPARFVGGAAGKCEEGHAWVTFEKDGKHFLLEPQRWYLGLRMPRILTLQYQPETSVGWGGENISYYVHESREADPSFRLLPGLVFEYLNIYGRFWARLLPRIPLGLLRLDRRRQV